MTPPSLNKCSTGVDNAGTQNNLTSSGRMMSRASSQALTPDVCQAIDTIRCIYAIDTVTAGTETGLLNGFAWLIYFNVVKNSLSPRLETQD